MQSSFESADTILLSSPHQQNYFSGFGNLAHLSRVSRKLNVFLNHLYSAIHLIQTSTEVVMEVKGTVTLSSFTSSAPHSFWNPLRVRPVVPER